MKLRTSVLTTAMLLAGFSGGALANCDSGEIVIKFSHVTNTDKHPKGIAATLLEQRVNDEMNGVACMEVFPNSTLYDDCLLYTSPSPRDQRGSRMPSSA